MTKTILPIVTEHSTEWHWWAFSDFCKLKAEVKEPSPHLQMIGALTEGHSKEDVVWFSCLYAAFYNIPSALVTWREFPWAISGITDINDVQTWLTDNWAGLFTRTERRAVRTVANMTECIMSLGKWAGNRVPGYLEMEDTHENYDLIWQETDKELRFMGRYIIIRLLEALHRFSGLRPHLYDIRSIGGWSPKRALGLMYPDYLDLLLSPDTRDNVARVDALAFECINKIKEEYGVEMSPYVFAAMLCEYRVAYEKRHQYPGWTIDQEPAYWWRIRPYWKQNQPEIVLPVENLFFETRLALFPIQCLGEINGWGHGTRIETRSTLRDYGYNWIDTKYDFNATKETGDFSNPVLR